MGWEVCLLALDGAFIQKPATSTQGYAIEASLYGMRRERVDLSS